MAQLLDLKKSDILIEVRPINADMPGKDRTTWRFRDDEDEIASQVSSTISLDDLEPQRQSYRGSAAQPWWGRLRWRGLRWRRPEETEAYRRARRRRCCRMFGIIAVTLTILGAIAGGVYIAFVSILIRRLAPLPTNNGLQHIVDMWEEPNSNGAFQFDWRHDFSRDIVPKTCHSHDDYWRAVPLYAALASGCTSIEADIWLTEDEELLVSHSWESTTRSRTLKSLYLDPIMNILEQRNATTAEEGDKKTGVFDMDANATTVLVIDFKSDGEATWPVLLSQLAPLREKNWLTYYDGETFHQGPLTIVGTGNAPFSLIQAATANRYIFMDAPLLSISNAEYNTRNSYYASAALSSAVGKLWFRTLSPSQMDRVREQIEAAEAKGLKSRYWDTPSWPIGRRDEAWRVLTGMGVGVLNVDDLVSATMWNWGWCVVAGIALCGNS